MMFPREGYIEKGEAVKVSNSMNSAFLNSLHESKQGAHVDCIQP